MGAEGWIKLHRKFLEWEWFSTPNMVHLFIHLLLSANHEDGRWQGVDVKRGQLITGRRSLSEKTGISEKAIRTCLSRLEETGEISKKTASKFSIITICKYDNYQSLENEQGPAKGQQRASKGPAKGHKQEEEECKNEKKEKDIGAGKRIDPASLRPSFIPQDLWVSFLDNRKFKKLQNSEAALKAICGKLKEAVDQGWPIDDCIGAYVSSKWQRFDVSWMDNQRNGRGSKPQRHESQKAKDARELLEEMRGVENGQDGTKAIAN